MSTPNYQSIGRLAAIFQRTPALLREVFERLEIVPCIRINDAEYYDLDNQQEAAVATALATEEAAK